MDSTNEATSTTNPRLKVKRFEPPSTLEKTIVIQQSIQNVEKKGPAVILRSADLNDIRIIRTFDEGSKPLFEREDVKANAVKDEGASSKVNLKHTEEFNIKGTCHPNVEKRSTMTLEKFIKNYKPIGKYEEVSCCNSSEAILDTRKDLSSRSNRTEKPREKVPYFSDPVRERDRLKRLYETSSRRRSRSRTPAHSRRHSPVRKRRSDYSPRRRRSKSREKHRSHSPYRASERDNRDKKSHRRSHSRSPKRDHTTHKSSTTSNRNRERYNNDHKRDREEESIPVMPRPYFPVPMADYAYSYPHWPVAPPPIWGPHPSHRPPPSHYGPYPLVPMIPAMRPPHHIGYAGPSPPIPMPYAHIPVAAYRPRPTQRYPQPRQNTNNFRYKKPST